MYPSSEVTTNPLELQKANNHIEVMKGVVFLLTQNGRILFIGEKIADYIGYTQLDLVGLDLLDYTHPGDKAKLLSNIQRIYNPPTKGSQIASIQYSGGAGAASSQPGAAQVASIQYSGASGASSHPGPGPSSQNNTNSQLFNNQEEGKRRRSFYLRIKEKPKNRVERPKYEHMHVIGHVRDATDSEKRMTKNLDYVFVGMMKTVKDRPINELNLMDAIHDQYITRHLPDGKIIFCDQRISTVAGYMPDEVRGHSAFNYMLGEDLPWTTLALRTMFASATREGLVIYRLKTANGGVVTLESRGFLELNKEDGQIEQFVCINTLLTPEEGSKQLEKQRERFTPMITDLQNYGINKYERLPDFSSSSQQRVSKCLKRKAVPSDLLENMSQAKYRAIAHHSNNGDSVSGGPSGRLLKTAMFDSMVDDTSTNGGPRLISRRSAIMSPSTSATASMRSFSSGGAAANDIPPDLSAADMNPNELVNMLVELDTDDIVNCLQTGENQDNTNHNLHQRLCENSFTSLVRPSTQQNLSSRQSINAMARSAGSGRQYKTIEDCPAPVIASTAQGSVPQYRSVLTPTIRGGAGECSGSRIMSTLSSKHEEQQPSVKSLNDYEEQQPSVRFLPEHEEHQPSVPQHHSNKSVPVTLPSTLIRKSPQGVISRSIIVSQQPDKSEHHSYNNQIFNLDNINPSVKEVMLDDLDLSSVIAVTQYNQHHQVINNSVGVRSSSGSSGGVISRTHNTLHTNSSASEFNNSNSTYMSDYDNNQVPHQHQQH